MSTGEKLLAEWFWIDRWDGSSAALLNMECQGVYRSMLSQAWRRGAQLPNDHEAIRRAIRCTSKEWARCWPKVEPYWRVEGNSLVNDTQLAVYAECQKQAEAASNRGRAGAAARWPSSAQGHAQASPQAPAQGIPSGSGSVPGSEERSTRGKVFVGSRLVVSHRQHDVIVDQLGSDAGYVDWNQLYVDLDAALVASGEAFDALVTIRQAAQARVKALRRGGALFSQPAPEVDWFEECQQLHGGGCGGRLKHHTRMQVDAAKAAAS